MTRALSERLSSRPSSSTFLLRAARCFFAAIMSSALPESLFSACCLWNTYARDGPATGAGSSSSCGAFAFLGFSVTEIVVPKRE